MYCTASLNTTEAFSTIDIKIIKSLVLTSPIVALMLATVQTAKHMIRELTQVQNWQINLFYFTTLNIAHEMYTNLLHQYQY